MSVKKGRFIGFEGIDGSGKGTQWQRALAELTGRGVAAVGFDFPRYGQASAVMIEMYLRGDFGLELDPKVASSFYISDRLAATPDILRVINGGAIALTNRFTLSNAAYQGCQIADKQDRIAFYDWLFDLEHTQMGIPEPDISLYLRIDPALSQENVDRKGHRDYVDGRDIHEADLSRLVRARNVYDELVELYPCKLAVIDCMGGNCKMLPEDAISKLVSDVIRNTTEV